MTHLTTQFKLPLHALATALSFATMAVAQMGNFMHVPLTVNGSAKISSGPEGFPALWLTPAQAGQAGTVFTTNKIVFSSNYTFSTFFQFQMTDPGLEGASDGMNGQIAPVGGPVEEFEWLAPSNENGGRPLLVDHLRLPTFSRQDEDS